MLTIAVIGLLVNIVVAFFLGSDHQHDRDHDQGSQKTQRNLNVQSAFLHVVGDAISSVGVILAAILIRFTGIKWIDPLFSILIGIIIFLSAFRVLRSALHILLEGVPEGFSLRQINELMNSIQAVKAVYDLHVWNLCSDQISLSAHIVLKDDRESEAIVVMNELRRVLPEKFHIQHTTIQFENTPCPGGCGGCN